MKVSIITVCFNSEKYIQECIESVLTQSYQDIEYIIIDGNSSDNTMLIIEKYKNKIANLVSESDENLYDAMNKGIKLATGEIVGLLNSDDLFADKDAIKNIVHSFDDDIECVYANLDFFNSSDAKKVTRHWNSSSFHSKLFLRGDAPPHPTFYTRRHNYTRFGFYNKSYKICADFDLMLRFILKEKLSTKHLDQVIIKMRLGGKSTENFKIYFSNNIEKYQILSNQNLKASWIKLYSRYLYKFKQLILLAS